MAARHGQRSSPAFRTNENVNAVREDPVRRGLLFAGTERAVYVSFDDGDHWQSCAQHGPKSVRDVIIKDDDLVAATHGRGFWIMDDITPLRQVEQKITSSNAYLFKPQTATRVRWAMNPDTPLPPDFPAAENPPDGAVINYYLQSASTSPVTLEIKDRRERRCASIPARRNLNPSIPCSTSPHTGCVRRKRFPPKQACIASCGTCITLTFPALILNIPSRRCLTTPPRNQQDRGPSRPIRRGADRQRQNIYISRSPLKWIRASKPRWRTCNSNSSCLTISTRNCSRSLLPRSKQARLQKQLKNLQPKATGEALAALKALDQKLQALAGGATRRPGAGTEPPTLGSLKTKFLTLFGVFQEADVAPSTQAAGAVADLQKQLPQLMQRWEAIKSQDIPALNKQLKDANLPELKLESALSLPAKAVMSSKDED